MNHCYRLVFNKSSQVWQAVSEIAKSCGKSNGKSAAVVLLPILGLLPNMSAWADPALNALPTGGQVTAGQSTITQNGNQLNIVQGTQKSIINWNTYNIGANAQVTYVQPNANAISLNRVTSGSPSEIFGKLNANGQVWLINPNGVLFGQNAQVNVGGIVATTLNIADDDFLNGQYKFTGNAGSVINMGSIVAANGGYVAMLAPEVRNEGVISAMQGTVAMAAGNAMTLDFSGNGLINVQVDSATVNTLVENKHLIQVGNGQVLMSTKAADGLITSVINNTGKIEANSMVNDGGVIRLTGAKTVINNGEISATSSNQKGGTVHLLGENVGMFNTSSVNVSGKTGGGTILVGGDFQGKNANIQNATKTFVHQDAKLIADATESGDGGKVIVWANDITRYYGNVSAKGGAISGNGGFVEISGKRLLNFFGGADLSAVNGQGGNLLLDPENITITNNLDTNTLGFTAPLNLDLIEAFADDAGLNSVFDVTALTGSFAGVTAGSTITLQANNDITIDSVFNVATATGSVNNSLVLEANNNINVNAALTLDGTGALTLKADADNSGVGNLVLNAAIVANVGGVSLFAVNINSSAAGTINTGNIAGGNGGNVIATAKSALNLLGAIDTSGTAGGNAGDVTLTAQDSAAVVAITANGSSNLVGNQNGGNGGNVSIVAYKGITTKLITAFGADASGSGTNGGRSGNISVTNQNIGITATNNILIDGTLTIFAGNGAIGGVGGTPGSIVINNQASLGNITTQNLSAKGQAVANGGNINVTSLGNVSVNGFVDTSSIQAPGNRPGANAGNITIAGVNRNVTGVINANGGAARNSNQTGGNAGVISITGSGMLNTAAVNARAGAANGTGAGGLAGSINLTGSDITAASINTAGQANGNGGTINANANGLLILNGAVTSSGGAANLGSAGKNAGAITLSGNVINAAAATISAAGSSGVGTSQIGGNGSTVALNGSGNISTNTISATGGSATATNAAGGDAGSITITTTAGDITTNGFSLDARTGAGMGSGGISTAGFIAVTNTSVTGSIITSSINTSGNTNGNGGNVSVKGKGTVTIGAVNVSGGDTTGSRVGRGSGNVTIEGTNRTIDAVTANGSSGSGTNQTGGKAGAVSVTGNGILSIAEISTKTGSPTGTGAFGVEGSVTLTGTSVTTSDIDTSPVTTGKAGNVSITTTGAGNSNVASINASNLGVITINNADTLTINGVVAGTDTTVTKSGAGKLVLAGNNTYTGLTSIQNGTLSATSANALGATSSGTTVGSSAILDVDSVTLAAEAITLNNAATLVATNAATVTGTVSAADNSKIGTTTAASTLTIGGVLNSANGNTLEIIGAGDVVATNALNNVDIVKITSAKNVILSDVDSMRFSGTASSLTGNLIATAANSIVLQSGGSVTSTTGDILFTSNTFTNNAGANALVASSGRWVVHTNALAGNTFGSLNSGNQAIYSRALGVATTETGNRYVFAESPALNITSINQSKTYGADASAAVASAFSATPFVNAATYGNVFTQDTVANSLTGSATSTGSATASNVGSYAIDVSSIASTNGYTLTKSNAGNLTVNAAVINLAGTRVYDATTDFNASVFGPLNGVNGQTLNLSGTGSVASKNVGTQTLSLGNLALTDGTGSAANYTLLTGTHTGTITQAALNLSAVADTKTYDGTTASNGVVTKSGLLGTDSISNLTQIFGNKNVLSPASKILSVDSNYVINDGNNGNNYMVNTATASGSINALAITGIVTAVNKTYDGNDTATISGRSLTGVIGLDNVIYTGGSATFDNRNAGIGKTVTATGLSLTGTDAGNYTVNTAATTTANINKATLNLNAVTDSKTYDGNTDSTGAVGTGGLVGGDTVTSLSQRFASKNVLGINGSTLVVNTGYTVNDGNNGNNYTVNLNNATGTITPLGITGNITASNKIYDGNNTATIASGTLTGVLGLEDVNYTGGSATFSDKNVGNGKTVSATGLGLSGNDAGNYTVNTTATTTANITPAALTVKANNTSKLQGTANPAFSSSFVGFVGGDTASVFSGTLDYTTLADINSPIGNYSVTPFGVTASNYTISFVDGIFSVVDVIQPVDPVNPGNPETFNDNISVFNNALTRPEHFVGACVFNSAGSAMISGLDAFGLDDVDYEPALTQPQVGGVVANATNALSCAKI